MEERTKDGRGEEGEENEEEDKEGEDDDEEDDDDEEEAVVFEDSHTHIHTYCNAPSYRIAPYHTES